MGIGDVAKGAAGVVEDVYGTFFGAPKGLGEYGYDPAAFDANKDAGVLGTQYQDQYGAFAGEAAGRGAFQMQGAQADPYAMEQQRGLIGQMQARVAGEAPSQAELLSQAMMQRNAAGASSMAASAQGVNPATALRMGMQQQNMGNQQAMQQMGALRAAEQAQAEQALGGMLSGMRGAGLGEAQMQQQAAGMNLEAQMGQQAQNDRMVQYYMSQGMDIDEANRQASLESERMRLEAFEGAQNRSLAAAQTESQAATAKTGATASLVGAGMSAFSGG